MVEQSEDPNKKHLLIWMANSNQHNANLQECVGKVKMVKVKMVNGKEKMVKIDLIF